MKSAWPQVSRFSLDRAGPVGDHRADRPLRVALDVPGQLIGLDPPQRGDEPERAAPDRGRAGLRRIEDEPGLRNRPAHTRLHRLDLEVRELQDQVGDGRGLAHFGGLEIVGQLLTECREQRGQGLLDTAGADGDLDCQRFLVEPEPQRLLFDAGQENRDHLVAALFWRFLTLRQLHLGANPARVHGVRAEDDKDRSGLLDGFLDIREQLIPSGLHAGVHPDRQVRALESLPQPLHEPIIRRGMGDEDLAGHGTSPG